MYVSIKCYTLFPQEIGMIKNKLIQKNILWQKSYMRRMKRKLMVKNRHDLENYFGGGAKDKRSLSIPLSLLTSNSPLSSIIKTSASIEMVKFSKRYIELFEFCIRFYYEILHFLLYLTHICAPS